ncbi:MAG: hypothetical protein AAFR76_01465 [Planctomycetota bacterium]
MTWGAAQIASLRRPEAQWVLETVRISANTLGTPGFRASSHPSVSGGSHQLAADPSAQGATLSPRSWSSTWGGFGISVIAETPLELRQLSEAMPRGAIVRLRRGTPSLAVSQWPTVAIGAVQNLRGNTYPNFRLNCIDPLAGLVGRVVSSNLSVSEQPLFSDVSESAETFLTADYTAGAGSITVDNPSIFAKSAGGPGAVLITPASGDPFYVLYSGITGSTLTLTGGNVMGTTRVNAVTGRPVKHVAYLAGHPLTIAKNILLGTSSDYPSTWRLGFPTELVDSDDITRHLTGVGVPATGSLQWTFPVLEAQPDPVGWLTSFLAAGGCYLTFRQGKITVRMGQATRPAKLLTSYTIRDADISRVDSYESHLQAAQPEYLLTWATTATGTSVTPSGTIPAAQSRPAGAIYAYDVRDRVFTNESAIRDLMLARLAEPQLRIPERLVLQMAGLEAARLAPGDVCPTELRRAPTRMPWGAAATPSGTARIDEVSPSWAAGTVRLGLLQYPAA